MSFELTIFVIKFDLKIRNYFFKILINFSKVNLINFRNCSFILEDLKVK